MLDLLEDDVWQMSLAERAAFVGLLSQLKPALAIELGTAQGASLARLAEWADEVHSVDLVAPTLDVAENAVLHAGDSKELLPRLLERFAQEQRNVDFVLVDGDHTGDGVRADIENLLNSPALSRTCIVVHDTANEEVRRGLDAIHFRAWPKVAYVDLDWLPGKVCRSPKLANEIWYGLGLILVDATRQAYGVRPGDGIHAYLSSDVEETRFHPSAPLLAEMRDVIRDRERELATTPLPPEHALRIQRELDQARVALVQTQKLLARSSEMTANLKSSLSWRLTAPLRALKKLPRRAARRA